MVGIQQYKAPVHRSLMQRELIMGVPQAGILAIIFLAFFFIYLLELYFMAAPVAIFYIVMRLLTKRDPYLVDIFIEHLYQKELLIP
jgi:type IV secretory pathway TrbD component